MTKLLGLIGASTLTLLAFGQSIYGAQSPQQNPSGWGPYKIGMTAQQVITLSKGTLSTSSKSPYELVGIVKMGNFTVEPSFFFSQFDSKIHEILLRSGVSGNCKAAGTFFLSSLKDKYGKPNTVETHSSGLFGSSYSWKFHNQFIIELDIPSALLCPSISYRFKIDAVPKASF